MIAKKFEKISRNIKVWSTRKSYTRKNTFTVLALHNLDEDKVREEMYQMRTDLGLLLKHVTRGAKEVYGELFDKTTTTDW